MRRRILHTSALFAAFALSACGADAQSDPQGEGWCVDESECADASSE